MTTDRDALAEALWRAAGFSIPFDRAPESDRERLLARADDFLALDWLAERDREMRNYGRAHPSPAGVRAAQAEALREAATAWVGTDQGSAFDPTERFLLERADALAPAAD